MTFETELAEKAGNASRELTPASPKVPASLAIERLLIPFMFISLLVDDLQPQRVPFKSRDDDSLLHK